MIYNICFLPIYIYFMTTKKITIEFIFYSYYTMIISTVRGTNKYKIIEIIKLMIKLQIGLSLVFFSSYLENQIAVY